MNTPEKSTSCQCACGRNSFTVAGKPVLRAICHCTICQEFNSDTRADIVIYRQEQVDFPDESAVQFRAYKQPPLVKRGKCAECGKPVIEHFRMPFMPALEIVPTAVHADVASLPTPTLHMFYHRRHADVADALPKYSGFLGSQLGFMKHLLKALRAS